MSYPNGQIPRSALTAITIAGNGQRAYLRADAARAFWAMNAESEARYGVTLRVPTARVAYRDLADQWYFWNQYKYHGGNLAAYPGTSNHGWGIAIDLQTPQMRAIVDAIGEKYGYAKKWSDAPSEWWHIRFTEGEWNGQWVVPTMRQGAKGRYVFRVQRALRKAGYKVGYDGDFGRGTRNAVIRFQKAHHLTADGVVGPATYRALHA